MKPTKQDLVTRAMQKPTNYPLVIELLQQARALIDTPDKWIQDHFAMTAEGDAGSFDKSVTDKACKFCMIGAMNQVGVHSVEAWDADRIAAQMEGERLLSQAVTRDGSRRGGVMRWNDTEGRTHSEVMDAFDLAIAFAESEAREHEQNNARNPSSRT